MSGIRRSTPHALGQQPISAISAHLSPPPPIATSSEHAKVPTIPSKYNENAVSILDFEAKVLYNQSMHSTIAREDAMATYYRRKTRKLELEIKKLERELGEGSRAASTMDEHDE
uniref:Uncharacterized protein n=1 Tax=Caenorhabditis japonica TaxID=281687 RepID=A0A8R1IMJ6_CAEJA